MSNSVEDIIKGAFRSVVNRVREMDVVTGTLVMTGGVANSQSGS